MKFDADFSELADLGKILSEDATGQAAAATRQVTIAEARQVKSRARAAAPRDRPWLANAIRQKTWSSGINTRTHIYAEALDPEGRASPFYVEYGTSRTPPQPFMGPALQPALTSYPAALLEAIDPFRPAAASTESGDE